MEPWPADMCQAITQHLPFGLETDDPGERDAFGTWYLPRQSLAKTTNLFFLIGMGAVSSSHLANTIWAHILACSFGTDWRSERAF